MQKFKVLQNVKDFSFEKVYWKILFLEVSSRKTLFVNEKSVKKRECENLLKTKVVGLEFSQSISL